jgi:hypothetical protein
VTTQEEDVMLGSPVGDVAPSLPDEVAELVASCIRFVHASTGMMLDFSSETLPILDHYLLEARADLARRSEAAPLVAQAAGAYFGQVLAKELNTFWHAVGPDPQRWLACCQSVYLAVNPIGIAYDILYEGAAHDGPSAELMLAPEDRDGIEQRLRALPDAPPGDYYTFSTRFDVIQIAAEALRAEMLTGGLDDVAFEWADYEEQAAVVFR